MQPLLFSTWESKAVEWDSNQPTFTAGSELRFPIWGPIIFPAIQAAFQNKEQSPFFVRLDAMTNVHKTFLFTYLFLAVLGLCCCTWVFCSWSKGGGLLSGCEIRRVLSPNSSVRLRWLNKCSQRLSLTSALWFSQKEFKFHFWNSRSREELRDYFIQVSHFFPWKIKLRYNGKELVQNHTMRSRGGTHLSLTLFKIFLTTQIASWFTHSFVYIFFPFESVFCTHESKVLTYLLSHHQYSYPCRWHLSRKGILPSGFTKKSVSSGKPQGCKAWVSPPIISNTEALLHGFVITLASVLSLFLFFNFNILKFKFLFIY